ncbi:MAG TPA: aldo/keto reductase [Spirochaetia bacterium]|nr:aldo/keto reductase [Spirochaetia bacterium]
MTVSRIGFGGIPIQRLSAEKAVEVIRYGLERGINWIDTAHAYGPSESYIGKAVQGIDRSSIKLFTKGPGKDSETIRSQLTLSLERLDTPYIDLYQFHFVPSSEAWNEIKKNGTLGTILRMKEEGLIRHIGASAHTLDAAFAVTDSPEVEVVQWPFNFMMAEDGIKVLDKCRKGDIGFIAMKPFGGGVLESAGVCIRFLLQFPDIVTDPGFEKVEEVEEVLRLCAESTSLSGEDQLLIEKIREELGTKFCRRCGYCSPCPSGVAIISIMTFESMIKRFSPEVIIKGNFTAAAETGENCIECAECEDKCPYMLPIRERIKEGMALLEKFKETYVR